MSAIGIDLGTSNSALAYAADGGGRPEIIPILQTVALGKTAQRPLLPSALYLCHTSECEAGACDLPWSSGSLLSAGEFARERAATAPDRAILSAKSWLCNTAVDRHAAILPWNAELEAKKLSPVEASQHYLAHLTQALRYALDQRDAVLSLSDSEVVVAVPASFDEVARSLTLLAAQRAGLGKVTLLEEPLAAFYAWIAAHGDDWRAQVTPGDVVLVCDVGGGTADFSLIAVSNDEGALRLDRISVGEHILLGGDNMDLALAVVLKADLEKQGHKLDRWQFMSLVQAARRAKEALWADEEKAELPVALAGRGSSLFASALSVPLSRAVLDRVVVEGFLPRTGIDEAPQERKSAGLQEYGLPYASDPALSRHLAHFLRRSLESVRADSGLRALVGDFDAHRTRGFVKPSRVLFNGGVFKAAPIRARMLDLLAQWCGEPVRELPGAEFDLAVALGAARYAQIRRSGEGIRIRAKTLRSYYIGVEASQPAVPGYHPPINGLCVVPQGLEEGSRVELPGREFGLVTGEPSEFRFFSSALRSADRAGALVEDAESALEESARLELALPAAEARREVVPVRLEAVVSEVGALELWLKHTKSEQRWRLEFNVRGS